MIDKRWQPQKTLASLPGHMGVFELADAQGQVVFVGVAGGRSPFGLRSEVDRAFGRAVTATQYRVEVTTAYLTRYQELLMMHQAQTGDHGALPMCSHDVANLGRLTPNSGA